MRALRTAVAGIADEGRKRDPAVAGDLLRRRLHLHADFPVAGVVAQRNRASVPGANAALVADNQHLFAGQLVGIPAHPGVLRHAEQVAAGDSISICGVSGSAPCGPAAWVITA